MRKIYPMLLVLLWAGFGTRAQHFVFDPTNNYQKTVSHVYWTHHTVFMQNLTGGELILGWERLDFNFPDAWQADLCDYVSCYMGIPESGTMLPVADTTRGFLKITLNPNAFVGTGTVSFRVYDDKHPEMADTVHFSITTEVLSALLSNQNPSDFLIAPNPASDHFNLRYTGDKQAVIKVLNAAGIKVMEHQIGPSTTQQINVSHLPDGLYLVVFSGEAGILSRQKLLIQ